jgi:glycosyltransferase-like protein
MNKIGRPLRIAILAHSTNPRGGVVHALELADALTRLGHEATAHAPDASGRGFFRAPLSPAVTVMATPVGSDIATMVEARIADYVRHFQNPANCRFDIFHAQDAISGNALATLKELSLICRFARTVHHIDHFEDPRLSAWQRRSIVAADELLVVSELWRERIKSDFGGRSTLVGNGVDTSRFTHASSALDAELRNKYRLNGHPILLSVGGVEERKNSVRLLEAFQQLLSIHPDAQFVIVGGASLLDHVSYRQEFDGLLAANHALERTVVRLGSVADAEMPSLYRLADALIFPSVKEGFGLVVLEAMACGIPVVTSRIPPFTEYLRDDDVIWCDPKSTASIANAMATVLTEPLRSRLSQRGALVARQHDWSSTAQAHLPAYRHLLEQLVCLR